ncbi:MULTISPECIES: hypothetical protein [Amycolatopsis]|nr:MULTISPECIES: hypothetical protein [Amycolatopsis]
MAAAGDHRRQERFADSGSAHSGSGLGGFREPVRDGAGFAAEKLG